MILKLSLLLVGYLFLFVSCDDSTGKGEKLEEEIDQIGMDMQTSVVQEDLKINDEFDLKQNIENFTVSKMKMKTGDSDVEVLEQEENGQEIEENDRSHQETDFSDFPKTASHVEEISEKMDSEDNEEKAEEVDIPEKSRFLVSRQFHNEKVKTDGNLVLPEVVRKVEEVREEEEEMEEDDDWISWDLIHFLLLLSPYDEEDVTWWTIIFEAVKCSLRNCPNSSSHWHEIPVHLPRITRHRRQDSEFLPNDSLIATKTTPCPCRDLENYFEKLYESIGKAKKKTTL